MENERHVRLFRNGRNQALRIPREFELPGDTAILHRQAGRLVIEPVARRRDLQESLATLQPLNKPFPDIDDPSVIDEDVF